MARDTLEATAPEIEAKIEVLPSFTRKWWHRRHRLDARPIMWSLRNRPQEWSWHYNASGQNNLYHIPSRHMFAIGISLGFWRLRGATQCSCSNTSRKFQFFQNWGLSKAYREWRRNYGNEKFILVREKKLRETEEANLLMQEKQRNQFINHFIHCKVEQ